MGRYDSMDTQDYLECLTREGSQSDEISWGSDSTSNGEKIWEILNNDNENRGGGEVEAKKITMHLTIT